MRSRNPLQGSASILVVLIMLTLSIFGVISLVSAYSDYKLAERSAEWMLFNVDMETEGQQMLGELNETLAASLAASGSPLSEPFSAIAAAVAAEQGWTITGQEPLTVSRTIDDGRSHLRIELTLHESGVDGRHYTINTWRQEQDEFEYDNSLKIWDGM